MPDTLADRVTVLTVEAKGLREEVGGLREQLATMRGRVWWVLLVAVIAVGLAGGLAINVLQTRATSARVDAICPVLALVVGGSNPETRPPGPARDAYVRSMAVMNQAYLDADCSNVAPLVPPRTS